MNPLNSSFTFESFSINIKDSKSVFIKLFKFYFDDYLRGIKAVYCNGSSSLFGFKLGSSTSIDLNIYNIYKIEIRSGAIIDGFTIYVEEKLNMTIKNKFIIGGSGGTISTFNFSSDGTKIEKYDLLAIFGYYGNFWRFGNIVLSLQFKFQQTFMIKSKT